MIYDTIALGYPEGEPGPKTLRTLEKIVHYEQFDMSKAPIDKEIIEKAHALKARLEEREGK